MESVEHQARAAEGGIFASMRKSCSGAEHGVLDKQYKACRTTRGY